MDKGIIVGAINTANANAYVSFTVAVIAISFLFSQMRKSEYLEISELLFQLEGGIAIEHQLGSELICELPQLLHSIVVDSHGCRWSVGSGLGGESESGRINQICVWSKREDASGQRERLCAGNNEERGQVKQRGRGERDQ